MLLFPSGVKVRNVRLQLLRDLMLLVAVIACVSNLAFFAKFHKEMPIEGVFFSKVIGTESWNDLSVEANRTMSSPLCTEPDRYSWVDSTGSFQYNNFSCMRLCPEDHVARECLSQHLLSFQESETSFIVTALQDTFTTHTGTAGEQPRHSFFVPALNALSLEIKYTLKLGASAFYSNTESASTTIARSDGTLWKRFDVGQDNVRIHLLDLLSLAGTSLDAAQPSLGPNYFNGTPDPSGPTSRVAGMNLKMYVECVGRGTTPVWKGTPSLKCTLQVRHIPGAEALRSESGIGTKDGSAISLRVYRGIRVTGVCEGKFKTLDFNSMLVNLTTTVTLLALPHEFIFYFALLCLGHLSRIYTNAVRKELNISKECSAMSLRLMAHSYMFSEMQNQMAKDGSFENGIIDQESMTKMWTRIMNSYASNVEGAEEMASFFMHQIVSSFKHVPASRQDYKRGMLSVFWNELTDDISNIAVNLDPKRAMAKYASSHGTTLSMENFQAALCSAEPISFDSLVRLFDRNRPVGRVEQFFTPMQVRICLAKARSDAIIKGEQQKSEQSVKDNEHREQEGAPRGQYTSARYEISVLQENLEALKQNMSGLETQLLKLKGEVHKLELPAASCMTKAGIGAGSCFVSKSELDSHLHEMMEVVDRRCNQLRDEFRGQLDGMASGLDAIAARTFRGGWWKDSAQSLRVASDFSESNAPTLPSSRSCERTGYVEPENSDMGWHESLTALHQAANAK